MKVRIQNDDGIGYTTRITDAETGGRLDENIYRAHIRIDVQEVVTAVLYAHAPLVDVIADAEINHTCPCCGGKVEPKSDAS